jgi:chromosome segregation ATPase
MPAPLSVAVEPDGLVKLTQKLCERRDGVTYEDDRHEDDGQEGLRARSEQALGELAQALIENPTLHNAVSAAFEAQQAAMSALNLPSAGDLERVERRLRSFSQRLEDLEEQIDELSRELGTLRRQNAATKKEKAAKQGKD